MGMAIDRERFREDDYQRFSLRLEECLEALSRLLETPGFGEGSQTLGAELELFLIAREGRPLPVNQKVLESVVDPRLTYELDRFNVECNLTPGILAGQPFGSLRRELVDVVAGLRRAARAHRGDVVGIGILPTLKPGDLGADAMTDVPRYRALSLGLRRRRRAPYRLHIDGADPLRATCDDVTFEGANSSFQIHLRVSPARYAQTYNAAQLATAPVLAAAGNSPLFLGHRLWEETRIALFKQSVDHRPAVRGIRQGEARVSFGHAWLRESALELFAENVRLHEPLIPVLSDEDPVRCVQAGQTPVLGELRLHQGTIWRWNRPVYDHEDGGHLRIEMRALPSGPTVTDMLANAAFLVGLTLAIEREGGEWTRHLPFEDAHANFYRAARHGLRAHLRWPWEGRGNGESQTARELIPRLLPLARKGLTGAGVATGEAESLLAVIEARVQSGQTGAVWQRRTFEALEPRMGTERALATLTETYTGLSHEGTPVHLWPTGTSS